MKKGLGFFAGFIIVVALFLGLSCMVVTGENEYKLVRQFGKIDHVQSEAGLSFKMPFIQTVDSLPKYVQIYDLAPSDVITRDKKTMITNSYVLWQITDPIKFAQTLNGSIGNAENRINTVVYINADPNRSDLVEVKRVDGRRAVVVWVEGDITVNGIEVDV